MKFFATALASWIFFLMALPAVNVIYSQLKTDECSGQNCGGGDCTERNVPCESPNPYNDCCPNGMCNPLQYCSCCAYLTSANADLDVAIISSEKIFPSVSEKVSSNYSSDCFRPPEIA